MSDVNNVLFKIFVKEFYRMNAGFFILVVTLTFGFMSGVEHKALAQFFTASPALALIPVSIWLTYMLKIFFFNRQRINLPENSFVFHIGLLPKTRQFLSLLQTLTLQFLPAIAYAIFLIAFGIKSGCLQSVMVIVSGLTILLTAFSIVFVINVNDPSKEIKSNFLKRLTDKYVTRPVGLIYINSVLRHEPFLVIGTKVFTGLLLFGIIQLYRVEVLDGRLLGMAVSLAAVANFNLLQQLQLLDHRYLSLMKNLPISLQKRWLIMMTVIFQVMIPESTIIVRNTAGLSWTAVTYSVVLMMSVALITYSLLYIRFRDPETFPRLIFALAMGHIVLILFNVPSEVFILVDLVGSFLLFARGYYEFELSTD